MSHSEPLSSGAQKTRDCEQKFWHDDCNVRGQNSGSSWGWGGVFLAFVVIFIIIAVILYVLKPESLQSKDKHDKCTGDADLGRVLAVAFVIALILCFVLAIFGRGGRY